MSKSKRKMAINFTDEQFTQMLDRIGINSVNRASLDNCKIRFNGSRRVNTVEEFINTITVYKHIQDISDDDALAALPIMLQNEANTWWSNVKDEHPTWERALAAIRKTYAPSKPRHAVLTEIFLRTQKVNEVTEHFITDIRSLITQLPDPKPEVDFQLDMVYGRLLIGLRQKIPRGSITTFTELLEKARAIEEFDEEKYDHHKNELTHKKQQTRCSFCDIRGHMEANCRKKAAQLKLGEVSKAIVTNSLPPKGISCFGCGRPGVVISNCPKCHKEKETSSSSVEFYALYAKIGRDCPIVQIQVFSMSGFAQLDTAARMSIAGSKLYELLVKRGTPFDHTMVHVKLADGSAKTRQVLTTIVPVQLGKRVFQIKMACLPDAVNSRTLLGIDFLEYAGIVINAPQRSWKFVDEGIQWHRYDLQIPSAPNELTNCTVSPNSNIAIPSHPIKNTQKRAAEKYQKLQSIVHQKMDKQVSEILAETTAKAILISPIPNTPPYVDKNEYTPERKIRSVCANFMENKIKTLPDMPPLTKIKAHPLPKSSQKQPIGIKTTPKTNVIKALPEMPPLALIKTEPMPKTRHIQPIGINTIQHNIATPTIQLASHVNKLAQTCGSEAYNAPHNQQPRTAQQMVAHSNNTYQQPEGNQEFSQIIQITQQSPIPFTEFSSCELTLTDCPELNVRQLQTFNNMLQNHTDIFNETGPSTIQVKHHITLSNNMPIASTPYRLPNHKKDILRTELNKMIAEGIIEESDSPWASPVVMVGKKDGSIRVCVDYRKLNAITIPDRYPLPRMDDLLHEATSSPYMTTLDLRAGYWQIEVNDDDKEKTGFITPFGIFQFNRMAFGLRNAPATFQRLMDRIKNGLPQVRMLVYLDDLIIRSSTFEEHMQNLNDVFTRLKQFNLRINRNKCKFSCSEVKYLGHIITKEGIKTDPDKVSAMLKRAEPRNQKEVISFIQSCSWYRRFINNFSAIISPLSQLLKKNATWTWDDSQKEAYTKLKYALTTAPILKQADTTAPFTIKTDASNYAIGAVLLQGEGENEHVVEYASRLLIPAERNYSTTEREALALVWAVDEKFRGYIDGGLEVKIATDHQALKWLMSLKSPSGRLARWALRLQPYNLTITYIPGRTNVIADTLSRPPIVSESTVSTIEITLPHFNPGTVREEQRKDKQLKTIIDSFESKDNDEQFARYTNVGYLMHDGILYKYTGDGDEALLVIPEHEQADILYDYHDAPTAGHYGIERTLARIMSRYYWTGMRKQITEYIHKCIDCQRYKAANTKPVGLFQSSASHQRFEIIAIDLFGPLPKTETGHTIILIIEDVTSRWVELFPLEDATAEACGTILLNEIFLRFGLPRKIISDNGPQFVSAIMQTLTYCLDIKQTLTPFYHPEANPVERKNRDLKPQLAILTQKDHRNWANKLPAIRFAMNTAKGSSTGFSAAYLTFGRELRTPDDIKRNLSQIVQSSNATNEIYQKMEQLNETLKEASENTENVQQRNQQYTDRKRIPDPGYKNGDQVWVDSHVLSNAAKGITSKLTPKRDGPYTIVRKYGPSSYEIAHPNQPDIPLAKYHTSALKPYQSQHKVEPIIPIRKRGRPKGSKNKRQIQKPTHTRKS